MKANGKGAVGVFAPSGLGVDSAAHLYQKAANRPSWLEPAPEASGTPLAATRLSCRHLIETEWLSGMMASLRAHGRPAATRGTEVALVDQGLVEEECAPPEA